MRMSLALLFTCAIFLAYGQPGIDLKITKTSFLGGESRSVYELLIRQASKNDVLKGLESRLEKGTKQKATVEKSVISIDKVVYKKYWSDSLVIVSEVVEVANGVMCQFAIDLESVAIDSTTNRELDVKVRRYLTNFGLDMYSIAVEKELKVEEKSLKQMEKDYKSAVKMEDKQVSKINNEKLEIENSKESIEINLSDQQSKIEEMQDQKSRVSKADGEQKSIEKEKLSSIKSELKKLKKTNKKLHKDVFKRENHIRDLELEVQKAKSLQAEINERISNQNEKIQSVHQKQFAIEEALKKLD